MQSGHEGPELEAQQLLAQLLPFHHREAKVGWWAYFDRKNKAQLSPDELIDDGEAIAGAEWTGMEERPSARTGADIHHFRFDPSQPLKLHGGDGDKRLQLELPDTGLKLDVDALDAEQGRVSLKLPWSKRDQRIANGDGEGIPKGPHQPDQGAGRHQQAPARQPGRTSRRHGSIATNSSRLRSSNCWNANRCPHSKRSTANSRAIPTEWANC